MPKNSWTLAAAALLLCFPCPALSAAISPRFTVDAWTADEGLPQSSVIAMTQTRDGYLWLGTVNGLVRFDGLGRRTSRAAGLQFPVFDDSNTPGLRSSVIVKLFEDSHGNLWVGTETAGVVMVKDGKVVDVGIGRGTREGRLRAICEDASGAVWLYTADGRLHRYQQGRAEVLSDIGTEQASICRALIVDDSGVLWVGMDWKLLRLAPGSTANRDEFRVSRLDFLLASKSGGFWCFDYGHIRRWKAGGFQEFAAYPWNRDSTPVNAACEDHDGNLIVGTGGEGVFWFDAQGRHTQLAKPQRLSHNTVLSLCVDREGDLWVGTDGGGVNRVEQQVFEVLEDSQVLAIKSVCQDGQRGLWLGSFGHGVSYFKDGVLKSYDVGKSLYDQYVVSVFVDHGERVWAGTVVGDLFEFKEGAFLAITNIQSEVSAFYQDRSQRLWVGTQTGLACWDGTDWRVLTTRDGLSANIVAAIAEDLEGNLWVGTEGGGLTRMRAGHFDRFGRTNGLPSDNVYSLYADAEGALWAGTSSGLARFQNSQWTSFSERLGLASHSVGYLLEDGQGNLWLGSNVGVMRISKKALNDFAAGRAESVPIRYYGKPDGLPTRECTRGAQPAACRDRDGRLWLPTIKGLASVNPALLTSNTNPPPVIIEAVRIDGILQSPDTLRAPPITSLTIPPGKESLEIDFTSLNLSAPDKGLFKYRLEGHEKAWTEVQATVRSVRYSKVPHGHYKFQVTACNQDRQWNPTGCSLGIIVLPPFWQTWWFLSAATLAVLGVIVGVVHFVSTQKLHRQLETLRQQEALEKERARIARDIHDQLGANLTQVSLLGELLESDKDHPKEVEAHARQISQTALDTTRTLDEIVWTVNPSNDTLDGLVTYVCKYAQEYLAVAGLRYRLDVPSELPAAAIPPEVRHNVFLASKEAITNVVRHAHASTASLRLRLEPTRFALEIEDNGRGLAGVDEKAAQSRNGLRNMRKRMEDIGGAFSIGPAPEGGTLITLTVPLTGNSTKS